MVNMQLHWLLEKNKEIFSLILLTLLSFLKTTHLLVNMFHSLWLMLPVMHSPLLGEMMAKEPLVVSLLFFPFSWYHGHY